MKESTFIELLNLYIDQQISPPDAAQLEQEILNNPRRRRVYQQYCRMHRACTIVLENYGAAEEGEAVADYQPRERRPAWGYYAAGLAAACVAVVTAGIYLRSGRAAAPNVPASAPIAAAPAGDATVEAVPVRFDVNAPGVRRLGTIPSVEQDLLRRLPAYGQSALSVVMVDPPAAARVPLRPLSLTGNTAPAGPSTIEQFVFQSDAPALDTTQGFRLRRSTDAKAEMTAYQFQR